MSTQPIITPSSHGENSREAVDLLDALSSGTYDQEAFERGASSLARRAPETGWELLALVDQFYRRGRISGATFHSVKASLQNLLLGEGRIDPGSMEACATAAPIDMAAARTSQERLLAVGDVLAGRYRVQAVLGQGGMGTVFEAIDLERLDDERGDQRVALKVLHGAVIHRPRLLAELRREFRHLQLLSHPNIVRVHEFDSDGDIAFFTMDHLSGTSLSGIIAAGLLQRPHALTILRKVGAAVAYAHFRGVVHGDLNPENIFITDDGEVRVLDFGASHRLHRCVNLTDPERPAPVAVATPTYASCQVLEGGPVDPSDDVYALACIAVELLSGTHPFQNRTALAGRTLGLKPKRPRGLSGQHWDALSAGLRFDRKRRPGDLQAWLDQCGFGDSTARLPMPAALLAPRSTSLLPGRWAAAFGAALVMAAAWWILADHASFPWSLTAIETNIAPALAFVSRIWSVAPPPDGGRQISDGSSARSAPNDKSLPGKAAPTGAPTHPDAALRLVAPESGTALPIAPPVRAGVPDAHRTAAGAAVPAVAATARAATPLRTRIELSSDVLEVTPADGVARIIVHRSRSLRSPAPFRWWTESGTAQPGRDFVAVQPQVEIIPEGRNSVSLLIPIFVDGASREPRSFYVVIDEATDDVAVGPRTLQMVTILPAA